MYFIKTLIVVFGIIRAPLMRKTQGEARRLSLNVAEKFIIIVNELYYSQQGYKTSFFLLILVISKQDIYLETFIVTT